MDMDGLVRLQLELAADGVDLHIEESLGGRKDG